MTDIDVGGGPAHNRVSVSLVGDVDRLWKGFIQELSKPGDHGINNNELKSQVNMVFLALDKLNRDILLLPAQGRTLDFSGTASTRMSGQLGRSNGRP